MDGAARDATGGPAAVPGSRAEPLAGRLRRWQWPVLDALAAGFVVFMSLSEAATAAPLVPVGMAVRAVPVVLAGVPLAVRRRWPVPVCVLVLVGSAAGMLLGDLKDPFIALGLALYPVGLALPRRRSLAVLAIAVAVMAASIGLSPEGRSPDISPGSLLGHVGLSVVVLSGAWALGWSAQAQRAYAAALDAQAAHQAVTDERLRIARELHDVVSHSMSVIAVRASVANYVTGTAASGGTAAGEPAVVRDLRESLGDIELTSREALLELRHLLGVLRSDGERAGPAALVPAPSLAELDRLVAEATRAGVVVELRVTGTVRALPPGLELSAYRIVQEALTNTVRHAAPSHGTVVLDYRPDELSIEVTDDGPGRPDHPDGPRGHGLIGMRERVALYGGRFEAGPLPGRGFRVRAGLPVPGGER